MLLRAFAAVAAIPTLLAGQRADKDSLNSALLWRDSVSFFITPPVAWSLNSVDGKEEGTLAVLYRRGESCQTGLAVMYANMLDLPNASQSALATKVDSEVAVWSRRAGDATITALSDVTVEGHTVLLRKFVSPSHGAYAAVAYFWQPTAAPILVLSARSEAQFQRAYSDSLRLVRSYGAGPKILKGC